MRARKSSCENFRGGGGKAGEGRFLDASMAIEAANPEFAGLMLVAEGDRLVENDILAGHVGGMHITIGDANRQKWKKRPANQNCARNHVCAWAEDLH